MKQKFNIVVPMAGRGSRFTEQGYTDSKPFIDVNGKPMIHRVIENLGIEFDKEYMFILICLQEDYDKFLQPSPHLSFLHPKQYTNLY